MRPESPCPPHVATIIATEDDLTPGPKLSDGPMSPKAAIACSKSTKFGEFPASPGCDYRLANRRRAGPLVSGLFGFGGARDDEVVVDAKDPGRGLGLQVRNGCIALAVDDPVEGNVAIFHNNVDGMDSLEADHW